MRGLMDEAWFVDCDLEDALAAVIARQVQSLPLRSICLYLPIAKLSMVLGLGSFKRWLQPECFLLHVLQPAISGRISDQGLSCPKGV